MCPFVRVVLRFWVMQKESLQTHTYKRVLGFFKQLKGLKLFLSLFLLTLPAKKVSGRCTGHQR